jgi:GDP-L-fucose synthase
LWGNGTPKREIIYVDDLADACLYFMKKKTKHDLINIGTGNDYSIEYYARKILKILIPNKNIKIKYDKSKPNGTPRKMLDVSLAKKYGWKAKSNFKHSIIYTYSSFLKKI